MKEKDELLNEEDALYENYRIIVDKGQGLLRIDKFLMARIEGASRNKIQNAAKANCIQVNNIAVKPSYRVKPEDVITILLPNPPREIEIIAEDIPLDIVYEDEHIILINKPAGMVVHPGYGNYTGTLLNALTFHFQNQLLPEGQPVLPLLVHRIDKGTSGILIVAKTELAQSKLAKQFYNHTIQRKYFALVWGNPLENEGTIVGNLGRDPKDRKVMTVFADGSQGKHAITHYKVIERFGYVTLVECILETGRTHQIRVHMRYIGHPLFNDATYGGNRILKGTTFSKYKQFVTNCFTMLPRQALHAASLGFVHPATDKNLFFEQPFAADMEAVIEKWRKYSSFKEDEVEEKL